MKTIPVYEVKLVQTREPLTLAESQASTGEQAAKVLHALIGETDREHFALVFLDVGLNITGVHVAHIGSQSRIGEIDRRVILRAAINACASAIIVGHNHPSGNPTPSSDDRAATVRLIMACEAVGIDLVDHVIVTPNPEVYAAGWMHGGST